MSILGTGSMPLMQVDTGMLSPDMWALIFTFLVLLITFGLVMWSIRRFEDNVRAYSPPSVARRSCMMFIICTVIGAIVLCVGLWFLRTSLFLGWF